jgi:hypothetical protein
VYRVDARLLSESGRPSGPQLEDDLHEAMSENVQSLRQNKFKIVRIETVPGSTGAVAYYDVSIRP